MTTPIKNEPPDSASHINKFLVHSLTQGNLKCSGPPYVQLQVHLKFVWMMPTLARLNLKNETSSNGTNSVKKFWKVLKCTLPSLPFQGSPSKERLPRSIPRSLVNAENAEGKENALYYLTRTLLNPKEWYTSIEKVWAVLIFAIQKLRHYLLALPHKVDLNSGSLQVHPETTLNRCLAKWQSCSYKRHRVRPP